MENTNSSMKLTVHCTHTYTLYHILYYFIDTKYRSRAARCDKHTEHLFLGLFPCLIFFHFWPKMLKI